MALIHCDFFSEVLGMSTSMTVILPQPGFKDNERETHFRTGKCPVLYLLHGFSDDHTAWIRRTSIERYVAHFQLAVVMPNVHRSYYTNMAAGGRYWTFVSEELPRIAQSFFGLSDLQEDNFVAGLSMGGYGAFKLALGMPENFSAAASLSGALDLKSTIQITYPERKKEWENIFGDPNKVEGSENDLLTLARNTIKNDKSLPKLYQWCGTEDFLYPGNINFLKAARELNLDLTYDECPGDHSWGCWDRQIQRVLEWLPLTRNTV